MADPTAGEVIALRERSRRMCLGEEKLGTASGWTRADQHGRHDAFDLCKVCGRAESGECSVLANIEHLKQFGFRPIMWECAQFLGLPEAEPDPEPLCA